MDEGSSSSDDDDGGIVCVPGAAADTSVVYRQRQLQSDGPWREHAWVTEAPVERAACGQQATGDLHSAVERPHAPARAQVAALTPHEACLAATDPPAPNPVQRVAEPPLGWLASIPAPADAAANLNSLASSAGLRHPIVTFEEIGGVYRQNVLYVAQYEWEAASACGLVVRGEAQRAKKAAKASAALRMLSTLECRGDVAFREGSLRCLTENSATVINVCGALPLSATPNAQ